MIEQAKTEAAAHSRIDRHAEPIVVGGKEVRPGQRMVVDLPLAKLYTHTPMTIAVHVWRGRRPGPCIFVSAAIHGDELLGVEIIRRLLQTPGLRRLKGTLIAVPIVNVFGFVSMSRYLPDRRDLNRAFPGSAQGSLAARLAHIFMREIVAKADYGIDLHTGSNHRTNLPQIRACLDLPETERIARAFGAPVIIHSDLRDGSLRQAGSERGLPMLLYEAGEALRFDERPIKMGLRGIRAVMRAVGMLPANSSRSRKPVEPLIAPSSSWERAPISGVLIPHVALGARVDEGTLLGDIVDPFGSHEERVHARFPGVVIGRLRLPLVHQGDAIYHIACLDRGADSSNELAGIYDDVHDFSNNEAGRPASNTGS